MESSDVTQYVKPVCAIAHAAGAIIKRFYADHSAGVRVKADKTPVTDADMAAHQYILSALLDLGGGPVISEESAEPLAERPVGPYWLVDPLDGTKEFIARTDEFTVNIALIHQGRAVLGVIYAPIPGLLYYAAQGSGCFKQVTGGAAQRVQSRPFAREHFILVASRRHSRENLALLRQLWPGCQVQEVGSSLKFCFIAEGRADIYLRQGPTSEWDTAAAQCILEEAGGKVVTAANQPLTYNKNHIENPEFLAAGDRSCLFSWFVK